VGDDLIKTNYVLVSNLYDCITCYYLYMMRESRTKSSATQNIQTQWISWTGWGYWSLSRKSSTLKSVKMSLQQGYSTHKLLWICIKKTHKHGYAQGMCLTGSKTGTIWQPGSTSQRSGEKLYQKKSYRAFNQVEENMMWWRKIDRKIVCSLRKWKWLTSTYLPTYEILFWHEPSTGRMELPVWKQDRQFLRSK